MMCALQFILDNAGITGNQLFTMFISRMHVRTDSYAAYTESLMTILIFVWFS